MARAVLRKKFLVRCLGCNEVYELNEGIFAERERENGMIPFKSKSSSSTLICPKCKKSIEFTIFFEYRRIYRKRCNRCDKMFDSPFTFENKCLECSKKFIEDLSKFGE